jgi:hypothetical protein
VTVQLSLSDDSCVRKHAENNNNQYFANGCGCWPEYNRAGLSARFARDGVTAIESAAEARFLPKCVCKGKLMYDVLSMIFD